MENNMMHEDQESDFQIKEELAKYLIHWKWFVLSVSVLLFASFIKLRYTIPLYRSSNSILLKEQNSGGILSDLASASTMGYGRDYNYVDNEILVLESRSITECTVKKMDLNISYVVKGKVLDSDLYSKSPVKAVFQNKSFDFYEKGMEFLFTAVSDNKFVLKSNLILSQKMEFGFGESIHTKYGDLVIQRVKGADGKLLKVGGDNEIHIIVSPLESVVGSLKGRLSVAPAQKWGSVLEMAITDQVPDRAADYLNTLVECYNENAIRDKNYIIDNTSKFIADRLELITEELGGVEKEVEEFKRSNQLIDVESQASNYISGVADYNKKIVEIEAQQELLISVIDFIKKSDNSSLLPSNLTVGEASDLIGSYNDLVLSRNSLLKTATLTNPTIVKIDQQIASLKTNIKGSLKNMQATLNVQKRNLINQEGLMNAKIEKIPTQERQFKVIARQQKVKEELYLYLLQKREEMAITLSATEPNAKVIEAARPIYNPISPNANMIYMGALVLGLLIPVGIIFLADFLDNKVKSRLDIERKTIIPFIGDVPRSESPNEIIQSDSRTSSAEALRIVRTNLAFMLSKAKEGLAKTIFFTSTFSNEGKTFISANLAATFALSGKKVLLIGMDIRSPKLDEYFNLNEKGLTNYLTSKDLRVEDLIVKQNGHENFDILPAGIIPPNPAELLMSEKLETLFETLKKQYDYILVDTAPVSLVADTLLIAKYADCFVYVMRANFLEKRMLSIPNTLYKENKLPNMCLLLNDTDSTKGYGYGYGYGVLQDNKEPFYKKIFKF